MEYIFKATRVFLGAKMYCIFYLSFSCFIYDLTQPLLVTSPGVHFTNPLAQSPKALTQRGMGQSVSPTKLETQLEVTANFASHF